MEINSEDEKKLEELCAQAFDFARNNDKESLEILLNAGLNINLTNHKGNTLLMLAAYNNSLDVARMLLERGADVDKKNDRLQTPLAGVCFKGYYEMAKLLVEAGANVDDNESNLSPMNCALMFRRKEILSLLLKHSKKKPTLMQRFFSKLMGVRGGFK